MGRTLRNFKNTPHKEVFYGFRNIKDGEAAIVWGAISGRKQEIVGPKRVFLFLEEIRFLDRFKALSDQYLLVEHADGRNEHVLGPAVMFRDPQKHVSIMVRVPYNLTDPDHCVVVYTKTGSGNAGGSAPPAELPAVERRLVRGPAMFIPNVNDRVHAFFSKGRKIIKTNDLRTGPFECPLDSRGGVVTVSAEVAFSVADPFQLAECTFKLGSKTTVGLMLDAVATLKSAFAADLSARTAQLTFDAVPDACKAACAPRPPALPALLAAAATAGLDISAVTLRGVTLGETAALRAQRAKERMSDLERDVAEEDMRMKLAPSTYIQTAAGRC